MESPFRTYEERIIELEKINNILVKALEAAVDWLKMFDCKGCGLESLEKIIRQAKGGE